MAYELDKFFQLSALALPFETHVLGIDGECFQYSVKFETASPEDKLEEITDAVCTWNNDYEEKDIYTGYIDITADEESVGIYLDLGNVEPQYQMEVITGILQAISAVSDISCVLINEDCADELDFGTNLINTAPASDEADTKQSRSHMDPIWAELYQAAQSVRNARRVSDYVTCGEVGAAILSKSGKIYTGICIDTCSTLGICAERNAIFNMLTCGEQEIDKVLCILPDGSNGAPCGACRELMVQLMPKNYKDIEIMLDYASERMITLGEITPEWWIS